MNLLRLLSSNKLLQRRKSVKEQIKTIRLFRYNPLDWKRGRRNYTKGEAAAGSQGLLLTFLKGMPSTLQKQFIR